jgi:hypothetical protein
MARTVIMILGCRSAACRVSAESELAQTLSESHGRSFDPAEAYRMWGGRFFPVAPARPTPAPGRVLVPASRIGAVLDYLRSGPTELAVLGSVARDGSALVLTFASSGAEGRPQNLSGGDEAGLVGIARSVGGDLYHTVLKQRAGLSSRSTSGQ